MVYVKYLDKFHVFSPYIFCSSHYYIIPQCKIAVRLKNRMVIFFEINTAKILKSDKNQLMNLVIMSIDKIYLWVYNRERNKIK